MKMFIVLTMAPIFFLACAGQKPLPQPVSIADPGLASALAAAGLPADQLTTTALHRLQRLDASGRNIGSLSGIEYCSELIELDLSNNNIEDIGPLAALRGLAILNLSSNRISDIGPLSRLYRLNLLYLQANRISDISALSLNMDGGGFPPQSWIHLEQNPLGDKAMNVDIPYLVTEGVTITFTKNNMQTTRRPVRPSVAMDSRLPQWRPLP